MGIRSTAGGPRRQPHLQEVNRWRAWADARKEEAVDFAQQQFDACRSCRECDAEVKLTEKICPYCGVSDPVRVPMTVPTALGLLIVTALCVLICV